MEKNLYDIKQWCLEGRLDQAEACCGELLNREPGVAKVLTVAGLVAFAQKNYHLAVTRLGKAAVLQPDNAMVLVHLGDALMKNGQMDAAVACYEKNIRLDPGATHAKCQLGGIFLSQDKFDAALPLLEEVLAQDRTHSEAYFHLISAYIAKNWLLTARIYMRLLREVDQTPSTQDYVRHHLDPVQDTLFLDSQRARQVAGKKQRVRQTTAIDAPQICYHLGPSQPEDPVHVISVFPEKELTAYFVSTRLRLPAMIDFDPHSTEQINHAIKVAHVLDHIPGIRASAMAWFLSVIHQKGPKFGDNEPLRVFIPSSRLTTVMQYCSRDMARAFARKGCQVKFVVEENDLENLSGYHAIKAQMAFEPHITLNINHVKNLWLHPDVRNIVWWQDQLMQDIMDGKPLVWRENDLVLSIDAFIDRHVSKTRPRKIMRQNFCVDTEVFFPRVPLEERKKIVFVGGSYMDDAPKENEGIKYEIFKLLEEKIEKGAELSYDLMNRIATEWQQPADCVFSIMQYLIRQKPVTWLCSMADSLGYEVEIYGRGWEHNPVVRPFFKGPLPHGPELCNIYNQAKYSLSSTIFSVQTQRLVETAACGCIPVVFD